MRAETIFVSHLSEWTSLDCLAVFRWSDATTPRTERPVRFHHGKRYERSYFGTLLSVVPFSRIA
jgi:hypothetical protein